MLIVFGGLPGTGKTIISRMIAIRRAAIYLRIDAIEQAIRNSNVLAGDVGPAGYGVANVLAESNLAIGSGSRLRQSGRREPPRMEGDRDGRSGSSRRGRNHLFGPA